MNTSILGAGVIAYLKEKKQWSKTAKIFQYQQLCQVTFQMTIDEIICDSFLLYQILIQKHWIVVETIIKKCSEAQLEKLLNSSFRIITKFGSAILDKYIDDDEHNDDCFHCNFGKNSFFYLLLI